MLIKNQAHCKSGMKTMKQKSPYYKTIKLFNIKGRTLGLFEIYEKKDCKVFKGYSIKFKTDKIRLKSFRKGFYEYFDEVDEDYGVKAWDYTNKDNALLKLKELGVTA